MAAPGSFRVTGTPSRRPAGLLAGGSIDRDALLSRGVSFGSAHALTVLPSFSGEITGSFSCCR